MADISKCSCGTEPLVIKNRGRWLIACPNKKCGINFCSYPAKSEAVRNWNKEVVIYGTAGKRN